MITNAKTEVHPELRDDAVRQKLKEAMHTADRKTQPPMPKATYSDDVERDVAMASANDARRALPSEQNKVYSDKFAGYIEHKKQQISSLTDQKTVNLARFDEKTQKQIKAETDTLHRLIIQVEESRNRLGKLEEISRIDRKKLAQHYDEQVVAATTAIRAFEAAASELAKAVGDSLVAPINGEAQ